MIELERNPFVLVLVLILVLLLCPLSTVVCSPVTQASSQLTKTHKFINGRWFDGRAFRQRTFYSVDGILTEKQPRKIDEVIDLRDGYVVPPFGDSHCHHFDGPYSIAEQIEMYLRDGVFYAKATNNVRSGALKVAGQVNRPTSIDVAYAHGGLTGKFSHPTDIYEALALGFYSYEQQRANAAKIWQSRKRENDAYYIIDNADELERKWSLILEGRPEFIKVFLRNSELYEQRRSFVPTTWGRPDGGIDPKLMPPLVQKAHQAGLRVTAAVNSAYDFHVAITAGVDEISHLPGYQEVGENEVVAISPADAKLTAKRGVYLTLITSEYRKTRSQSVIENEARNLKLLKPLGVQFALGSDSYGETPLPGAISLSKLKLFNNLELLKVWCENTPQTIFPNRRIGRLRDGYEASFLVLGGNPLEDFEQVKNITIRLKQGQIIQPTA